jgi:hypothetical protein
MLNVEVFLDNVIPMIRKYDAKTEIGAIYDAITQWL